MIGRTWNSRHVLAVAACALASCARVSVEKVPTPTQYVRWTDDMQSEADAMEGIRFYLPRPFVSVFESFPVRTDVFLAHGVVSADGKYVVVESVRPVSDAAKLIASELTQRSFPTSSILKADPEVTRALIKAHTDSQGGSGDTITTGTSGDGQAAASAVAQPARGKTGTSTRKVTSSNGAFAFQPLRGNMDIVYLPDFEEQYCVSSGAGLGNAEFELNLGQGWSLQGFNSIVDNTELNNRMFDLIDTAISAAKKAAGSAFAGVTAHTLSEQITGAPKVAGEPIGPQIPGTPVTLRIAVVHYAAKGLYPVIKPRELAERAAGPINDFLIIDLFQWFPRPLGVSELDPQAIVNARTEVENVGSSRTTPRYPYQFVSFNTFRHLSVQVVRGDGPADDGLYDKTGTKGEAGDRQTGDFGGQIVAQTAAPKQEVDAESIQQALDTLQLGGELTARVNKGLGDAEVAVAVGKITAVSATLTARTDASSRAVVIDAVIDVDKAPAAVAPFETLAKAALDKLVRDTDDLKGASAGKATARVKGQ